MVVAEVCGEGCDGGSGVADACVVDVGKERLALLRSAPCEECGKGEEAGEATDDWRRFAKHFMERKGHVFS